MVKEISLPKKVQGGAFSGLRIHQCNGVGNDMCVYITFISINAGVHISFRNDGSWSIVIDNKMRSTHAIA